MTISDEKIKESLKDAIKLEDENNLLYKSDYMQMCKIVNGIFDGNTTGWSLKDKKEWIVGCDYYNNNIAYNIIQNKESNTMISFIKNNKFYAIKEDFIIGVLAIKVLGSLTSNTKFSSVLTDEFGNAIFKYLPTYSNSIDESNSWKTLENSKNKVIFEIKNVLFTIIRYLESKRYSCDMIVSYDDKPIINSKVTLSNINSKIIYSKDMNLLDDLVNSSNKVKWSVGKCYNGENVVMYYDCYDIKDQDYLIIRIYQESVANLSTFDFDKKYYIKIYKHNEDPSIITLSEEVIKPYINIIKKKVTL